MTFPPMDYHHPREVYDALRVLERGGSIPLGRLRVFRLLRLGLVDRLVEGVRGGL